MDAPAFFPASNSYCLPIRRDQRHYSGGIGSGFNLHDSFLATLAILRKHGSLDGLRCSRVSIMADWQNERESLAVGATVSIFVCGRHGSRLAGIALATAGSARAGR